MDGYELDLSEQDRLSERKIAAITTTGLPGVLLRAAPKALSYGLFRWYADTGVL